MTTKDKTAKAFSFILHPLMMPTLLFAIIFYCIPALIPQLESYSTVTKVGILSLKTALLLLIFMKTYILPAIIIYILYKIGLIKRLEMETIKERRIPYLVTVLIYTAIAFFFSTKLVQLPQIALLFTFITISICMVAVISIYWKISAHAVGISGAVGLFCAAFIKLNTLFILYIIAVFMVLSLVLLWSRLHLKAHTIPQVVAGYILGFTVSFCSLLLFFPV